MEEIPQNRQQQETRQDQNLPAQSFYLYFGDPWISL